MKKYTQYLIAFFLLQISLIQAFAQETKEDTCALITKEVDDFSGEVTFSSPLSEGFRILDARIIKVKDKKSTVCYLRLNAPGGTLNLNERGVTLIFTDGTKWKKDVKISVSSAKVDWTYSAFITLKPEDLSLFSKKIIKKYQLFIYDNELSEYDGIYFRQYVRCIRKAK
jgi:hypothetical protein